VTDELAVVPIETVDDVFVLRQRAREASAAAGLEEADQVRVATALSEVGRELLAGPATGSARFALTDGGRRLSVTVLGLPAAAEASGSPALAAAARLVDAVEPAEGGPAGAVTLHKRLPVGRTAAAKDVRRALAVAPTRPLDELRAQNQQLIATLDELKARQDELLRLNAELEETNSGVLAMYGQLADELDETNRGVVALYAELDDKTVQLAEASEAKTRFLANVSHELRSPVHSILGLAQLLASPAEGKVDDEQRHQVGLISRTAGELLGLVNDLLDLAKAESGRLEPEIGPVDLVDVCADVHAGLRPLIAGDVELQVEAPTGLPAIETDADLLVHVLRNLLTNALKFTEHGSVRLSARALSPLEVALDVTDTGIGIAEADQARVFEEFFQVKGPLQARRRGTGLGLPYARRVARALGGDLSLVSTPGEGSTFTVSLPVRWASALATEVSPGLTEAGKIDVGTALLVDDDEGFRRILRGMLQDVAGQVLEASNGEEALASMASRVPDVVFLDLRMPDMDGDAVLARMGQEASLREVPVVIVTSADLEGSGGGSLGRAAAVLAKASLDRTTVRDVLVTALSQP
jgi:signal transduction histidine kinase